MTTLSIPDITITPALPDEDSRRTCTTPSASLPGSIIHTFRDVLKELHPRWSDADLIITEEELAKAPPMSKLPRILPRNGMPSPPCLQYGLPIMLE
ncbi:hypothetical protein HETIRDRAFT_166199 [Heterobasidion irregulare TC 32-1]|uniref:Uncharacterized protein n=1 Tax=Heterobasidion irregulare (strain TC 32-1) TaxID=747525 RepID=W4KLH8_HETIT|nr:uncharacterized protein HETIRDRAFT_166199 [Heterobasidion irregulare TC 32-1]ETW86682.1 hypothetical protein HETIRDRAFT_166199 [Heterobasidion irregulare TC 32-1]